MKNKNDEVTDKTSNPIEAFRSLKLSIKSKIFDKRSKINHNYSLFIIHYSLFLLFIIHRKVGLTLLKTAQKHRVSGDKPLVIIVFSLFLQQKRSCRHCFENALRQPQESSPHTLGYPPSARLKEAR